MLAPFYVEKEYLTVTWPNGEHTQGWTQESQFQQRFLPTVTVTNLVPQTPRIMLIRKNLALIPFAFTLDLAAGGSRQIGPGQGLMLWAVLLPRRLRFAPSLTALPSPSRSCQGGWCTSS